MTINNFILQKMNEKGRSIGWVARQVGCDRNNLRKTLLNNRDISSDLLFRISKALDEDFHAFYSQKLKE